VCIAELGTSCPTPGALEAMNANRAHQLVATVLPGSLPCAGCHPNNKPRSSAFGTTTGFAFADDYAANRIKTTLLAALKP
jgi:hypothetical protein